MKKIFWLIAILFTLHYSLFIPPSAEAQPGVTQFPIGFVWMTTDTLLHSRTWTKFCHDTLGFNMHMIGEGSLSDMSAWNKKDTSHLIAEWSNSPITVYSHAERMLYQGIKKNGRQFPKRYINTVLLPEPP